MGFDKKKFIKAKFTAREDSVPVPDMKEFFDDDPDYPEFIDDPKFVNVNKPQIKNPDWKPPVWKVRGLEGVEVARSNEAMEKNKNIATILEALVTTNKQEKIQAVKQLIGIDEKVPNEIAKRIELLILGSIDPVCDTELAVKICRVYPIEFYQITNKITELTGRGHVPGKQKASGETQKSK